MVPMHYKTPRINLNIQPVERFFEALPGWPVETVVGASEFAIEHGNLPIGRPRIVRLEHSR